MMKRSLFFREALLDKDPLVVCEVCFKQFSVSFNIHPMCERLGSIYIRSDWSRRHRSSVILVCFVFPAVFLLHASFDQLSKYAALRYRSVGIFLTYGNRVAYERFSF